MMGNDKDTRRSRPLALVFVASSTLACLLLGLPAFFSVLHGHVRLPGGYSYLLSEQPVFYIGWTLVLAVMSVLCGFGTYVNWKEFRRAAN